MFQIALVADIDAVNTAFKEFLMALIWLQKYRKNSSISKEAVGSISSTYFNVFAAILVLSSFFLMLQ